MPSLTSLIYLNRSPHREAIACLAEEEGLNAIEIHKRLSMKIADIGIWKIKRALTEMEKSGILIRVNNRFLFSEEWVEQLMDLMSEFGENIVELELYNLVIEKMNENNKKEH